MRKGHKRAPSPCQQAGRLCVWALVTLVVTGAGSVAFAQAGGPDDVIRKRGDRPGVIKFGDKDGDDKDDKKGDSEDDPGDRKGDINNPLSGEKFDIENNFDRELEEEPPIPSNQKVTIDFRKAELEEVVKFYSRLLKKNFIIADSLKAGKKITIIAPRQVTVAEAYRAFLAAMAMNGLTIVPHGQFLKIIDSGKAAQDTPPTRTGRAGLPTSDVMETRIIQIRHVSYQDIEGVISKVKSTDGNIISYPPTNTLIVTEYGTHMRRMFQIIDALDRPGGGSRIHIYQVQFADASELAGKLLEIFEQDDKSGRSSSSSSKKSAKSSSSSSAVGDTSDVSVTKLIADENTNQLIIVANERSYQQVVDLIQKLDVETNSGRIWVYPLQHAKAEDLAGVLSGLSSSNNRSSGARSNARNSRSSRSSSSSSSGGSGAASGGASGGSGALLSGDVQVTADNSTNSLILTASFKDYLALKSVIEKLDRRRKQVYVEAAIMEISLDRNRRVGIGVNGGIPQEFDFIPDAAAAEIGNEGLILAQANFESSLLTEAIQGQGGLGLGVLGPPVDVSLFGTNVSLPSFLLFLQATQNDQNVNILSTPSLMTLNNEEAEISVGERVPFFTGGLGGGGGGLSGLTSLLGGAAGGAGGAGGLGGLGGAGALGLLGGLGSNIDYQDVALTLRITPQINASGLVQLELDVTVEDLKPGAGDSRTPTTTKREAKTVVVAEDQQTIVIGGLVRDVENEGVVKVPFLGDIPILGHLFRRSQTTLSKQNLVILLTPYIIDSSEDLRRIKDAKIEEREEFLRLFGQYDKTYIARVNFTKKHGLLEEMNQKVKKAENDAAARRRAYGEDEPEAEDGDAPVDDSVPAPSGDDIIIVPDRSN